MSGAIPFYLAGLIAIIASLKVISRKNAVHALLYLVVSLLAVAVCFFLMGAPFAAGLEVIIYAGAILVLFVFAIMMFDMQNNSEQGHHIALKYWFGPSILAAVLLIELVYILMIFGDQNNGSFNEVSAKQVGALLYGPYLLAVEIASFLLLAGLVASYHFAKSDSQGGQL